MSRSIVYLLTSQFLSLPYGGFVPFPVAVGERKAHTD